MRLRWPLRGGRGFSLRLRLMLGAAALAVLFMLALLPALLGVFSSTLETVIEQRLASDASTLIGAARFERGALKMPTRLPDEEFNLPEAKLLGYIYDRDNRLVWRSRSADDESITYLPKFDGNGATEFRRTRDADGEEYFVYDVELRLEDREEASFSFIAMQPTREYQHMLAGFRDQLYIWLGAALLFLLGLLWLGLTWGFRSLRGLREELDQIESGVIERLSQKHPRELLRLTGSLNRLLDGERRQRQRYRDSLGDLAHSLKTPLSVLQSVGEVIATQPNNREQAQVLQNQVERMSQQIGYQLQRATLRKSGLVRHRTPLAPLLDTLCEALDKVYRDKRVEVERAFDGYLHVPMERGALLELLGNLLENAYRLCLGRIRVSARGSLEGCELWIEDDGPGVPADQHARVLQRGERLDTQHPGQGIGLAVVRDIIDSYEGELSLQTSSLGGAAFHIRLGAN
ncbi:ATP-binding protein [Pseudomonas sp. RIT-PI-AD]|uniref:ATP-binding protein n=1 Tax=Pseudomonas sp. RIT-PI-AD TaxID=3035294 RepID=UPI0021D89B05|nr:ATP-binding protein [Pseudomonas sp. RIT-PI-AD]